MTLSDFTDGSSKVIELPSPSNYPEVEPPFGMPFPNFNSRKLRSDSQRCSSSACWACSIQSRFPTSHYSGLANRGPHGSIWIYDVRNRVSRMNRSFSLIHRIHVLLMQASTAPDAFQQERKLLVVLDLAGCNRQGPSNWKTDHVPS